MTMQTIALLGGVAVLLALLMVVRRRRAAASAGAPAPAETSAGPGDHRLAPTGPMPLYAAEPLAAPAGPAAAPAAAAPVASHGGLPPAEAPPARSWPDGSVVTEPGWLMPGELEHPWQADFATSAASGGSRPEAHEPHPANGNGSSGPDVRHLITEAVGGFDPAAGWSAEPTGALTVELDRPAPAEEPRIPQWDPLDADVEPELPASPDPDRAPPVEDALPDRPEPMPEAPPAEPEVPSWSEMEFVPERELVTPAAEAAEPWAELGADPAALVPAPPAPIALLEEAPVDVDPAGPLVAWWDLPDPGPVRGASGLTPLEAATGRFALGGFALKPGHEAIAGVSFRAPLATAPADWAVAPADEAAPGTLVLQVDGAINCGPEDLSVLTDAGFAPTGDGFTVSIAARAPGPFAASGTFRVA